MSEAAAATAANTGGSIAPDAGGQDKGLESAVNPEQVQEQIKETPEQRRARFEQAIGKDGEFADFYQQGVDNAVKTRLARERAKVEKAMAAQQPVLDLLMARYGTRDLARLQESINADADWWQSYATSRGISEQQAREQIALQAELGAMKRRAAAEEGERRVRVQMERWDRQARETQSVYGGYVTLSDTRRRMRCWPSGWSTTPTGRWRTPEARCAIDSRRCVNIPAV